MWSLQPEWNWERKRQSINNNFLFLMMNINVKWKHLWALIGYQARTIRERKSVSKVLNAWSLHRSSVLFVLCMFAEQRTNCSLQSSSVQFSLNQSSTWTQTQSPAIRQRLVKEPDLIWTQIWANDDIIQQLKGRVPPFPGRLLMWKILSGSVEWPGPASWKWSWLKLRTIFSSDCSEDYFLN